MHLPVRIANRDSKIKNFLRAVSTSFLQKPGIYLLAEMQKCPLAKHEVVKTLCLALHNNYSSIEKLLVGAEPAVARQELHPPVLARPCSDLLGLDEPSRDGQEHRNPQIPDCAGTSFINVIYTRLVTFPSRKIS